MTTTYDLRLLCRVAGNRAQAHPEDGWAQDFAQHVPALVDELDAARVALVEALGSEGAVPLGGAAAGVRKLADQRDEALDQRDEALDLAAKMLARRADRDRAGDAPRAPALWGGSPGGWDAATGPTGSVGD